MHTEAKEFTIYVKSILNKYFENKKVLDVGSGDINGNNRFLFTNCEYNGNDVCAAPNVTIVSKTKDLPFDDETFDTIISTECFEHDPEYVESFNKIYKMLKPNGLFLFTCASTGRGEHGTRRTSPNASYGTISNDKDMIDYYKNLTIYDVDEVLPLDNSFKFWKSYYHSNAKDLYFFGIKNDETNDLKDDRFENFPKYENDNNIFKIDSNTKLNEFSKILLKYNTDKNYFFHNYGRQYHRIFKDYKNNNVKVLELGVFNGESLNFLSEYFENKQLIIGVDIQQHCLNYNNHLKKIQVEILNLNNNQSYDILKSKYHNFDIIIDDASHINTDMILSFENLFPLLNDNGVYIIEDTICYKSRKHNDISKPNILDYISQYTKFLNQWRFDSDTGIKDHCVDPFKINKKTNNVFENSIDRIEYGCSYIAIYKKIRHHWITK